MKGEDSQKNLLQWGPPKSLDIQWRYIHRQQSSHPATWWSDDPTQSFPQTSAPVTVRAPVKQCYQPGQPVAMAVQQISAGVATTHTTSASHQAETTQPQTVPTTLQRHHSTAPAAAATPAHQKKRKQAAHATQAAGLSRKVMKVGRTQVCSVDTEIAQLVVCAAKDP
jgi:hypothetical protein